MGHYEPASRGELLERIRELESLLEQHRRERVEDEELNYAWAGNLGHWYWNYQSNTVTFNPLKVTTLGYSRDEVPASCTYQYFTDMLHPHDYELAMDAMRAHLSGAKPVYEAEYRIRTKDGRWRWYHDMGRVTKWDAAGRPLLLAGIVFDITERKEMQQRLEEQNRILEALAAMDELTRLSNRRTVLSRLEQEVARAGRYQLQLTVLLLDIDHFKCVNDRHGHLIGDTVLARVAEVIQRAIRSVDFAGRYGGEEFLVVFPITSLEQAQVVARRISEAVQQLTLADGLRITVSGGLAPYRGQTALELIDAADKLLYQAKASGRNRIEAEPLHYGVPQRG